MNLIELLLNPGVWRSIYVLKYYTITSLQESRRASQERIRAIMGTTTKLQPKTLDESTRAFEDSPKNLSAEVLKQKMEELKKEGLEWDVK